MAGASADRFPVLIAGLASGLAGVFSMAAGEYMSSKSQHEIFEAQIVGERDEVIERPGEAEAEMAYMFEEDGLPAGHGRSDGAQPWPSIRSVLLKTMVEKELGLTHRLAEGSPMQGALIMGAAFGLGAAVPVIPYVLLPVEVAIWASVVATARRAVRDRRGEVALDAPQLAALRRRDSVAGSGGRRRRLPVRRPAARPARSPADRRLSRSPEPQVTVSVPTMP